MTDEPADARVHRLTGADLMQWQSDVGPVPQHVGAVLLLDGTCPPAATLLALLSDRLGAVPALRRRPARAPLGCGGWYWADDDHGPAAHVGLERVARDDLDSVLGTATRTLLDRMPADRSPWRARLLVTPDGAPVALLVVLHHVLADGVTGLALLGALVDGSTGPDAPRGATTGPPPTTPGRRTLAHDAWSRRLHAPGRAAALLRAAAAGRRELAGSTAAPPSALNRPTGPHRRSTVVDVDGAALAAAAHTLGASVNDVVLVAVGEALRAAAATLGERLDPVVVSVPVAVRGPRPAAGNAVGVMPVAVPTSGDLVARVRAVTAQRRARLDGDHGRSLPLVLLAFRVLRALHLVRRYLDRQRLVNTLLTALPAVPGALLVGGAAVSAVVPLVPNRGNTTVAFATVRYRGRLVVSVVGDPDTGPDGAAVAGAVRRTLDEVVACAAAPAAAG